MLIVNSGTASTLRVRGNTRPCYNIIEVENGRVEVFRKYPFKRREPAVSFHPKTHEYLRSEERIDSEITSQLRAERKPRREPLISLQGLGLLGGWILRRSYTHFIPNG